MAAQTSDSKYIPGTYLKIRRSAAEMASRYVREWDEEKRVEKREKAGKFQISP